MQNPHRIHTESGIDLIPANNRLDYFDKLMCNTDFAECKLKEYVDTIRDRYYLFQIDVCQRWVLQ